MGEGRSSLQSPPQPTVASPWATAPLCLCAPRLLNQPVVSSAWACGPPRDLKIRSSRFSVDCANASPWARARPYAQHADTPFAWRTDWRGAAAVCRSLVPAIVNGAVIELRSEGRGLPTRPSQTIRGTGSTLMHDILSLGIAFRR
jgi:hypothetical protein